jgi:hypothetical protein
MDRIEKCKLAVEKGFKYDPETGKVYGVRGKEITSKHNGDYRVIQLHHNNKLYRLLAHHFAWYVSGGNMDFYLLDHEDQDPSNNKIDNLSITSYKGNMENTNAKGYTYDPVNNKYRAQITVNRKNIILGRFDTPEEARQAYLNAKQTYHKEPKTKIK